MNEPDYLQRALLAFRSAVLFGVQGYQSPDRPERAPFENSEPDDFPSTRWEIDPFTFDQKVASSPLDQLEAEIETACEYAGKVLARLAVLAQDGNSRAGFRLAELHWKTAKMIEAHSVHGHGALEGVRKFTSRVEEFPVFLGQHKHRSGPAYIARMLEHFQFGKNSVRPKKGFAMTRDDGGRDLADEWVERLSSVQERARVANLDLADPLCPEWIKAVAAAGPFRESLDNGTAGARFPIAWACLMWAADDHPETLPEFADWAAAGKRDYPHFKSDARSEAAGILDALRSAWQKRYPKRTAEPGTKA